MKKIVVLLALLSVFSCTSNRAVIKGNIEGLSERDVILSVRDNSLEKKEIARTKPSKNRFKFIQKVDKPIYAYIGLYGTEASLVLEPGVINVVSKKRQRIIVSGTKYNDMLYNWQSLPEIKEIGKAQRELDQIITQPNYENESDSLKDVVKRKYSFFRNRVFAIESDELQKLMKSDDPYTKLFAVIHGMRYSQKDLPLFDELEKLTGSNPELDYKRKIIVDETARKKQKENVKTGKQFLDVIASTSSDESVKLSDVIAKNKFTLLEFWASWCQPCRQEIPHLKNAYQAYKSKGFEIFSYSIDSKREAWLKANEEEKLMWISVSGTNEEIDNVSKQYVVTSIPMSILIDNMGKIVALNLRGEALAKFLENNL